MAKSSGCPKLAGTYAWPPIEGAPQGYGEQGIPEYRKYPEFFGTGKQWQGELHLQDPDAANRQHLGIASRPDGVISKRYSEHQHSCKRGWRVLAEYPHPQLDAPKEYGRPVSMQVKLTTLANGDLVISQAMRLEHGKWCLFPWGGSCQGREWIPAADEVTWYWSRYRRLAP